MNNKPVEHLSQGAVMLPCDVDQFRDFIGGLLGKPQTIERTIKGPFKVDRSEVVDIHHLLEQRIVSQNDGALMQFTARIIYDDNSSVLLNSVADFETFNEVKPLVCESLVVTWVFLLQFRGRKSPERQTIDVSFGTDRDFIISLRHALLSPNSSFSAGPGIRLSISHTDRSWGSDIDNLLKGALEKLTDEESKVRKYLVKHSFWVGMAAFLTTLLLSVWGLVESASRIRRNYADARALLGENPEQDELVRFVADTISTGAWAQFGLYGSFFFVFSVVVALIMASMASNLADKHQPSFVLITKASEKRFEESKKSLRNNWLKLVGTGLLSGIAGAAGKTAFLWMTAF